jgi:stage II sporulation protein D
VILRLSLASRLTVAIVIALLPSVTYPAQPATPTVRVQLTRFARSASITISPTSGACAVSTADTKYTVPSLELGVEASRVVCKSPRDGQAVGGEWFRIQTADPSAALQIQCAGKAGMCVRGAVEARISGTSLVLVNETALEDYVLGVLPAEMPESYPLEALKAQAITIRTYAIRNKGKHVAAGCDVCDNTHCEMYVGTADGKPQCRRAVLETTGIVLTYGGEPAHVFFSADGGGFTQNYADAHPESKIPYLCGVKDPDGVPHTTWEKSYTLAELADLLTRSGIKEAEGLQSVRIAEVAATGRVLSLDVTGPSGTAKLYAGEFRRIVGLDELRSTLFTIKTDGQGIVTFSGKGYGHGLGLCQVGAKGLAQAPFSYTWDQILAHYFPGTTITSGSTTRVAQAPPTIKPQALPAPRQTAPVPKASPPPRKQIAPKQPAGNLTFDVRLVDPDLP